MSPRFWMITCVEAPGVFKPLFVFRADAVTEFLLAPFCLEAWDPPPAGVTIPESSPQGTGLHFRPPWVAGILSLVYYHFVNPWHLESFSVEFSQVFLCVFCVVAMPICSHDIFSIYICS